MIILHSGPMEKLVIKYLHRADKQESILPNSELFGKSPWGRFGEEALKFGENGFCCSTNKLDYF